MGKLSFSAPIATLLLLAAGCGGGGGGGGIDAFDTGSGTVVADFDGDGLADVAAAVTHVAGPPPHAGGVKVWLQSAGSPGRFGAATESAVGSDPWVLRVADVDGDGIPDLVAMSSHASADPTTPLVDDVTILRGDPQRRGRFLDAITLHAGARLADLVVADLDGDGLPDIAFSSYGSDARLGVWWNDRAAPGRYPAAAQTLESITGGALVAADLDGDGRSDLAVVASDRVSWLRHDPVLARRFGAAAVLTPEARVTCMAAADLDRDGRIDLVLANRATTDFGATGEIVTLRQDVSTAGGFAPLQRITLPLHAWACLAVDLDGNGWPDLAASGAGARPNLDDDDIELMPDAHALSAGWMAPPLRTVSVNSSSGYHLAAGDLDGDGRAELLMPAGGGVRIWRQDPAQPGALLPAPTLP